MFTDEELGGIKLETTTGKYIPKNYYVKIPEGGMTNPNRFHKLSIYQVGNQREYKNYPSINKSCDQ